MESVPSTNAFSPISSVDHAGNVWIITIVGSIYTGLAAIARLQIKWGTFGFDDYLLGLATALHWIQSAVLFYGLANGLGKADAITTENQWEISGKVFFVAELLTISALCLAKCSVVALVLRVLTFEYEQSLDRIVCYGLLFLNVLWGLGSVAGLVVDCEVNGILTNKNIDRCPAQFFRWQIITAVDIITEVLLWLVPVALASKLNMPWNLKTQVMLAFSFRLPIIVLTALNLAAFAEYPGSEEPQLAVTTTIIAQQVLLAWSLISATIPNMKSFMRSFNMKFGALKGLSTRINAHGEQSGNSHPLHSMAARSRASRIQRGGETLSSGMRPGPDNDITVSFRPDVAHHTAFVRHTDDGISPANTEDGGSIQRNDSQEMIIRKEIKWNVHHESC